MEKPDDGQGNSSTALPLIGRPRVCFIAHKILCSDRYLYLELRFIYNLSIEANSVRECVNIRTTSCKNHFYFLA